MQVCVVQNEAALDGPGDEEGALGCDPAVLDPTPYALENPTYPEHAPPLDVRQPAAASDERS